MRAQRLAVTCLVVTALVFTRASTAETFRLRPDGLGDAPNIQAAIDLAHDWSVIELEDGVYSGEGNRNISFRGKNIVLRSRSEDPTACIIDAMGSDADPARVILITNEEPSTTKVEFLTIRGGYLRNEGGWQNQIGAGIYIKRSDPTIRGCIITGNTSPSGGALMCYYDRSRVIQCEVVDNTGVGISGHVGNTLITLTTVSGNTWHGVVNLHSNMTLTRCTITDNGLRGMWTQEVSRSDLTECTITSNLTGGLVWTYDCTGTLDRCLVAGNVTLANGAGISVSDASAITLVNTRVVGNRAEGDGIASGLGGGVYVVDSSVIMASTTVAGNAAASGGGIAVTGTGAVDLTTTLIGANCADAGVDGWLSGESARGTATCSSIDEGGVVILGDASFEATNGTAAGAECFCARPSCVSAPTDDVDVGVTEGGPCAAGVTCDQTIGAGDESCLDTPVTRSSWGGVKARYAPEADAR